MNRLFSLRPGTWSWGDSTLTVLATSGPLLLFTVLAGRETGLIALCGGFASLYGLGECLRRRLVIVASAGAGMTLVMLACSAFQAVPWAAGLTLALTASAATYLIDRWGAGQPGMIMFLVTGSVALGVHSTPGEVAERALVTAAGATFALAVSLAQLAASPVRRTPGVVRAAVSASSRHACWIAAATAGTAALVIAFEVPHWQWAPISTAAVLQGTDTSTILSRAVQRSVGTVVGVLVTAMLLMTHPTFVGTVLLCAACLGASQLLFPRNYAFGIACVTPLAFLLPGIAQPMGGDGSLMQRVWATALGALLGVLMWYAAHRRAAQAPV